MLIPIYNTESTFRIRFEIEQLRKVGGIQTVISLEGNSASGEHKPGDRLGEAIMTRPIEKISIAKTLRDC